MGKRRSNFLCQAGHILEALLVVPSGILISRLPWNTARTIGRFLGLLAFYLYKKDKKWAYKNLDIIYADSPVLKEEKDRIIKRLFLNIGSAVTEYLKIDNVTAENYDDFITYENYEAMDLALKQNKGVIAVTAHFGNWEFLGSVGAKLGYPVATFIKPLHNPYIDRWLKHIRERKAKVTCYYHDDFFISHVSVHLKRNGIVALFADQRYLRKPVFTPFFGKQCATADGVARLHLWFEAPIVFCFCRKLAGGKYLLSCDGPYHFQKSGSLEKDCRSIMTFVNGKYEEVIRHYPDQWLSLLTPRWES